MHIKKINKTVLGYTFDGNSLKNDTISIKLSPKEAILFSLLYENYPNIVSFDDIFNAIWPRQFAQAENINRIVFTLRKKLGENHDAIENISRRGYRLARISNESNINSRILSQAYALLGFRRRENCNATIYYLQQLSESKHLNSEIYSYIAEIELLKIFRGFIDPKIGIERVKLAANNSIKLDNNNIYARATICCANTIIDHCSDEFIDNSQNLSDFCSPRLYYYSAWCFASLNQYDNSLVMFDRSINNISYVNVTASLPGYVHYMMGDVLLGNRFIRDTIKLFPWDDTAYIWRSVIESFENDNSAALFSINTAIEMNRGDSFIAGALSAYYKSRIGRRGEAEEMLSTAAAGLGVLPRSSVYVPVIGHLYGEDAARQFAQEAYDAGCPHLPWIRLNPDFSRYFEGTSGQLVHQS